MVGLAVSDRWVRLLDTLLNKSDTIALLTETRFTYELFWQVHWQFHTELMFQEVTRGRSYILDTGGSEEST